MFEKSFNLLRGREGCWLYGVYEIDINRTCVKVFRFISRFRVSRLTFIEMIVLINDCIDLVNRYNNNR